MVEFAIASGFFFMIIVGLLNLGYAAWERNTVATDAREGARWASVRGGASGRTTDAAAIQTYLRSKSSLGSSIIVAASWDSVNKNPGSIVTVTVTHVSPGKRFLPDTVRSTSSMVVEY